MSVLRQGDGPQILNKSLPPSFNALTPPTNVTANNIQNLQGRRHHACGPFFMSVHALL